jgi:hypothetical protein
LGAARPVAAWAGSNGPRVLAVQTLNAFGVSSRLSSWTIWPGVKPWPTRTALYGGLSSQAVAITRSISAAVIRGTGLAIG